MTAGIAAALLPVVAICWAIGAGMTAFRVVTSR
jgi:hypothetical protein